VASVAPYRVTVSVQPTNPNQSCVVSNGSGTVTNAPPPTVSVVCHLNSYPVNVNVSGLAAGTSVVLLDNGTDKLTIPANGTYAFPTLVASGAPYIVTVSVQPTNPNQSCVVSNGSGTVTNAPPSTVSVVCTTFYSIEVTVTGLPVRLAGGNLVLQETTTGKTLDISTNGQATFPTQILSGKNWQISLVTQPGTDTSNGEKLQTSVVCTFQSAVPNLVGGVVGGNTNPPVINQPVTCVQPGGFAYVTSPSGVTEYLINANTGALVPLLASGTYIKTGINPSSIAANTSAAGSWAYVADQGSNDLYMYSIDPNTGNLTGQSCDCSTCGVVDLGCHSWKGLSAPTSITLDNDLQDYPDLFVTSSGSNLISLAGTAVTDNVGALNFVANTATATGPTSSLYMSYVEGESAGVEVPALFVVSGTQSWTLSAYSVGVDGALTAATGSPYAFYGQSTIPIGPSSIASTLLTYEDSATTYTPVVYVTNPNLGTIQQYTVTSNNPLGLTPNANAPEGTAVGAAGPFALAINDAQYLYATGAQGVYGFSIDQANGSLTPVPNTNPPTPTPAGNAPRAIAAFESWLYVTNVTDGTISAYTANEDGTLTAVSGSPFGCCGQPSSIVVVSRPIYADAGPAERQPSRKIRRK
jgi:hypothetical protein